ncbi:MAG: ATP-binding protein, partial [Actinomycetota bacterium]
VATEARQADGASGARFEIGALPVLSMNPVRARQLFTNLLDNAVVHGGRPDVTVRVAAVEAPDGSVVVSVSDDGVGIPERYREKVFGVFERLEGRRGRGTGIGLAVCRKIVESIGGRIWIAVSEQGTDIRIEMPANVVHGWHAEVSS